MPDPRRPILTPSTQIGNHPRTPTPPGQPGPTPPGNDAELERLRTLFEMYAQDDDAVKGIEYQDPNTGAVYLLHPSTGEIIKELSGPIPGWQPGRGVPAPQAPPSAAAQWSIQTFPDGSTWRVNKVTGQREQLFGPKEQMPWENNFTKGDTVYRWNESGLPEPIYTFPMDEQEREKMAWERALEQQKLQQQETQHRTNAALNMFGALQRGQMEALPFAAAPGQQWHRGFEPGGVVENIARLSGRAYNPDAFRIAEVQYDPGVMWQQAWDKMVRDFMQQQQGQ